MTNIFNAAWKNILLNIFGITPLVIRAVDNITIANTKQQMFMAIFSLHSKYFDVVDFDYLFLDILDRIFIIEFYDTQCSYLDIASEIIADDEISENKLRNVLLNWIYTEPIFRQQLLIETPQAVVEVQPILVEATMV
jgi:hypothetical protein